MNDLSGNPDGGMVKSFGKPNGCEAIASVNSRAPSDAVAGILSLAMCYPIFATEPQCDAIDA